MAARLISYPHPVLGLRDDVEGVLAVPDVEVDCDGENVKIDVRGLRVTNETIQTYVDGGIAAFAIRVHCGRTYFRRSWTTSSDSLSILIPATRVFDEVKLAYRVVAKHSIPNYRPRGLHPDYGEARFAVSAGDVLAEGEELTFWLENDFDPLAGSVGSIMQVQRGDHEHGVKVDYQADKITVRIGKEDFDAYQIVRAGAPSILHSALVLPVLVEAIQLLRKGDQEAFLEGLLWSGRLKAMLAATQGASEAASVFEAAQALLQNPLLRTCEEARRHLDA